VVGGSIVKMSPRREEVIRLRREERLSIADVCRHTGVSKGSVSLWLRDYPLTDDEIRSRTDAARRKPKRIPLPNPSAHWTVSESLNLTRADKAKIAEAAVLFRIVLRQLHPFKAFGDGAREDWVVGHPGTSKMARIQVKWAAAEKYGRPSFSLIYNCNQNRNERRYGPNDFDFIVGYDLRSDTAHVFSYDETAHLKSQVTVTSGSAESWHKVLQFLL
jgi:transcriptional regulator with XRE-family HTH domain